MNNSNSQLEQIKSPEVIKREIDAFRAYKFEELSQNHSAMFNYFFQNNDLFQKIDQEDFSELNNQLIQYKTTRQMCFGGSLFSVFIVDQGIMKYLFPKMIFTQYRLLSNVGKYIIFPYIFTSLYTNSMLNRLDQSFYDKAAKYDFNYSDFTDSVNILEKITLEGNLEYLSKNRSSYDTERVKIK